MKLASNPSSPLFVRLASLYLDGNKVESALNLCESGVTRYPEYATAHLVLAKCYLRLQRFGDAKRELQRTLNLQPRCGVAEELVQEIRAHEQSGAMGERERSIEEEASTPAAEYKDTPSSVSVEDDILAVESFIGDQTSVEIATPTLAEIYASQGAFREAIRTYRVLAARKPEEKERFEGRIKELKERWRSVGPPS